MFVCSCKHQKCQRSFYYWQTVFHLSEAEKDYINDLNISKLYIRFFDVDWDETENTLLPVAKIKFSEKIHPNCEVVPVVYIVNRALQKSNHSSMPDLASKIYKQIVHISSCNQIKFNEIQLDCDWTEGTRSNFFTLLHSLKVNMDKENIVLSTTIRLHQVKYKNITGIPPVERGMLMYYNMGKISADLSNNSIYNANDAEKYTAYLSDYPLTLDIALPAYSWGIHIRYDKVLDLLNNMNVADFDRNFNFTQLNQNKYIATKSCFFKGSYFIKGDIVKVEEISPKLCCSAAHQLTDNLKKNNRTIAIFHLDSLIISNYEKKDFEKVFDIFN